MVPAYPRYLSGFLHALEPVPALADFVVETVSNAFGRLPDPVLLPWLPTLITTLRSGGAELAPLLIREAGRIFPGRLAGPGRVGPAVAGPAGAGAAPGAAGRGHRPGRRAAGRPPGDVRRAGQPARLRRALGGSVTSPGGAALLDRHPDTALALEALLAAR